MWLFALTALTFKNKVQVEVQFDAPDSTGVTIRIPKPSKAFSMAAWAPGDYQLFNYGERLSELSFTKAGATVSAERDGPNRWKIPEGADAVRYRVAPSRGNFSPNLQIRANDQFVSPPGVVGFFEGTESLPARLIVPASTKVALPEKDSAFTARDLDHLLDSPFVTGTSVREEHKTVLGKKIRIVGFGQTQSFSLRSMLESAEAAVEQGYQIFGELPYKEYTFFLDVGGPGGGLEHQDCCRIGLSARSTGISAAGILFHEYFHAYNVKRIRPKGLGPFDYSRPAETASLWWLEGVTDYYADVMQARAGFLTPEQFRQSISFTQRAASGPAYAMVSAEEAGVRVWESRGSFGFGGVSYYTKGKIVGAFLDLAIRGESRGKVSLDNVISDLYRETKPPKPGYAPDRIRELCIKYGGKKLGDYYDVAVRSAKPIPWDNVAASNGLKWEDGLLRRDAESTELRLADQWPLPIR